MHLQIKSFEASAQYYCYYVAVVVVDGGHYSGDGVVASDFADDEGGFGE